MNSRLPAKAWPAPHFIKEELDARGIRVASFLEVIGMTVTRWDELYAGHKGLLLKESQAIAGALDVSMDFIANLNMSYQRWKKGTP